MTDTTAPSDFWQRFEKRTAPFHLLRHSFYLAWSAGELTRDDLGEYAAEYWHHVSAFPTYLSALHSRLPDGELRREVLRNLLEEEGVDSLQHRPHADLWMDFAEGMGTTRPQVEDRALQAEMTALLEGFRQAMATSTAAEALAALYAYESRVPAIAREKAAGLRNHYRADERTTRYFTLHETADLAHAAVWRRLIEQQLRADPSAEEAVLTAGEKAAQALWTALDGIERERLRRNQLRRNQKIAA